MKNLLSHSNLILHKRIAHKDELFLAYTKSDHSEFVIFKNAFEENFSGSKEDLDLAKPFFESEIEMKLWHKFIEPVLKKVTSEAFRDATSMYASFIHFFKRHDIKISAVPRFFRPYQLDGGASLKAIIETLSNVSFKQEQWDCIDWMPNKVEQNEIKKNGFNFFLKEFAFVSRYRSKLNAPSDIYDNEILKIYFLNQLYQYKCTNQIDLTFLDIKRFFDQLSYSNDSREFLTREEQFMVARLLIKVPLNQWTEQKLKALPTLAKHIKYKLGSNELVFLFDYDAFSNYPDSDCLFNVIQSLIEFHKRINWQSLIKAYGGSTRNIKSVNIEIEQLKKDWWKKQLAGVSLEDLVERCGQKNPPEVLSPIAQPELQKIYQQMILINQYCEKYENLSLNEIRSQLIDQIKKISDNEERMIQMLASIRFIIRQFFGIYPYDLQLMVVLGIIQYPEQLKGRLAQVKTGEGKSTIVTVLASYFALNGHYVDVITSSESLAIRDYEKYEPYYKYLQITSSHLCFQNQSAELYEAQINFSTHYHIEWAIIYDHLYNKQLRINKSTGAPRPFDVVIVDEIDNLLIDEAMGGGCIAGFSSEPDPNKWVFDAIILFYKKHRSSVRTDFESAKLECLQFVKQYAIEKSYTLTLPDIILCHYLKQAMVAFDELTEGRDYIVKANQIHICEWDNTGKVKDNNRWEGGRHEMVELKHGISCQGKYFTSAIIKQTTLFNLYNQVFGLTGTIGGEIERSEVEAVYGLDSFDVPTYNPSIRKVMDHHIVKTLTQQHSVIFQICTELISKGRPVLVLLKSIKETNELSNFFARKKIIHQCYNDIQSVEESFILERAGHPGMITIATNTAGRGTDIVLAKNSKDNGGLHVILCFYPKNTRVEAQAYGRSGRQGQPGSWQFVLSHDEECSYNVIFNGVDETLMQDSKMYFNQVSKNRQKQIAEQSKGRLNQARFDKELFGFQKRFFDINVKLFELDGYKSGQLLMDWLSKAVIIQVDREGWDDVSLELVNHFQKIQGLSLGGNESLFRDWISVMSRRIRSEVRQHWDEFFDMVTVLTHENADVVESAEMEAAFIQDIHTFSQIFFDRYESIENQMFYFLGKYLLGLGIQVAGINDSDNHEEPHLFRALEDRDLIAIDFLIGNGAKIHQEGSEKQRLINMGYGKIIDCQDQIKPSDIETLNMWRVDRKKVIKMVEEVDNTLEKNQSEEIQLMTVSNESKVGGDIRRLEKAKKIKDQLIKGNSALLSAVRKKCFKKGVSCSDESVNQILLSKVVRAYEALDDECKQDTKFIKLEIERFKSQGKDFSSNQVKIEFIRRKLFEWLHQ